MLHGRIVILYLLATVVAVIAARVEYLNARAGHYLPRTAPGDVGKWRAAFLDEERWRRFYGPRDGSGAPVARELTADERLGMASAVAASDANARLRDWVGTAGLLQYLLLPALTVATAVALASRRTLRRAAVLAPVLLVIAFALLSLWHRGYFGSLGW